MLRRARTLTSSDSQTDEVSKTEEDTLYKQENALFEKRKKRYSKTPTGKKVPGFDISDTPTEKLELLVSLNLNNNPLTKSLKIKAAHELATRYIEGNESERKHKAPPDQMKAYSYAEKEINGYTIEQLEKHFFQIEIASRNINIVKFWLDKAKRWQAPLNRNENNGQTLFHDTQRLYETSEIDKFIDQAEWNGLLKKEKKRNANAILVAWEKQLIAARLAEHYKKLKKEKRDADSILAAKFYKRIVHHLQEHEPPDSHLSTALKKISPRFNQIRLLFSRIGKIFAVTNGSLPEPVRWLFNIAGLYFLIEFAIDLAVIIKHGRQAFWEDNRPSRMANSALWFALNFTCLMLALFLAPVAPPLSALLIGSLTVGGCIFDVGAEIGIGIYSNNNQQQMLDNIEAELAKLAHIDVNHRFTHGEITKFPENVALKKQYIDQKLALLETRQQILDKRKELYINRAYTVGIMVILTICAVLIFFPPAGLTLVPIIAGGVALAVGSIFGGIGKHIFWNAIMDPEFRTTCKEKFWQVCRWVKECFVPKVKAPFNGSQSCPDDHTYTSALLKKELVVTGNQPSLALTLVEKDEITTIKKRFSGSHLHRSSSGDLFSCVPPASAIVAPPAEPVHNIPLSL